MLRYLLDHSLSIFFLLMGFAFTREAFEWPEGKVFDLYLSLGTGALMIGCLGLASGPLRERNKPEK